MEFGRVRSSTAHTRDLSTMILRKPDDLEPVLLQGWVARTGEYIGDYNTRNWGDMSDILKPQGYQLNQDGNLIYSNGNEIDQYISNETIIKEYIQQANRVRDFVVDVPSVRLYVVLWDQWGDHPLYNHTLKEYNECLCRTSR